MRLAGYMAGLKPKEYNWMKLQDFILFIEADNKKRKREFEDKELLMKFQTYQLLGPHMKPITFDNFCARHWPSENDIEKERERIERLKNRLKQSKENGG